MARVCLTVGYVGRFEGHLWPLFGRLLRVVEEHGQYVDEQFRSADTTIQQVGHARVRRDLEAAFRAYVDESMARERPENSKILQTLCPDPTFRSGPTGNAWFDKTPGEEIIELSPRLLELYPTARFVFMKRRGVDNVLSACRRFGNSWFDSRGRNWTLAMEAWLAVRDQLGASSLELEHATLRTDPVAAAGTLGAFLGLDDRQVDWGREAIQTLRPEQTADDDVLVCTPIKETGWTSEQRSVFEEVCRPMMREYGYSF